MAKKKKPKETDTGALGRLSKAGEDALTRFVEDLGKNERVTDAVARAMAAKDKLDGGARRAAGGVGLAAAEELKDLRKHIERLEKRLAKLESESKPASKPRTTKPRTTAKKPAAPKEPPKPADEPPPAT